MFATKIGVKTSLFWPLQAGSCYWYLGSCVRCTLCLPNPVAGLISGVVCTTTIAGKVVYEKSHHNFKDVTVGYIIRQFIDANNLMVTSRREIAFNHNGHVTVMSSPTKDVNEGTNADNAEESVPTQSTSACR